MASRSNGPEFYGVYYLLLLDQWNHGFESHVGHGHNSVSEFLCVCYPVEQKGFAMGRSPHPKSPTKYFSTIQWYLGIRPLLNKSNLVYVLFGREQFCLVYDLFFEYDSRVRTCMSQNES
jgi:hypothetical protein